jgi:hypothetical protein
MASPALDLLAGARNSGGSPQLKSVESQAKSISEPRPPLLWSGHRRLPCQRLPSISPGLRGYSGRQMPMRDLPSLSRRSLLAGASLLARGADDPVDGSTCRIVVRLRSPCCLHFFQKADNPPP